jgi:acetyltransferase
VIPAEGEAEPGPAEVPGVVGPYPGLRRLYAPASIAIVGASPRSTIAPIVRDNLLALGSPTRCYFVNPNRTEAWGTPCHPSLADLPEVPELVVVSLNPLHAADVAEEAGALGVGALMIPGGGVVEAGEAAAAMQRAVREIAVRHGMAVLGPNCMGLVDFTTNVAAYIDELSPHLPRGGIAAIAQSGSAANVFLMSGARTGFSRVVSCGAEAVLDLCDHMAWSLDDPETHAIALFVEGLKRPERFLALADRALELGKPIALVKVGRSAMAAAAAIAHSGNLAGEDRAMDAAFEATGVIRCRDLDELLETIELIDGARRTRRRVGRGRTGLVTVSTGEASLVADLAEAAGFPLPPMPERARAEILAALPTMGFVANPLDPWGADEPVVAYGAAFRAMAGWPDGGEAMAGGAPGDAEGSTGAFDVLGLVHDFPYASQASELESCLAALAPLLTVTADRADLLPIVVSLTSGEPPPELLAALDAWPGGGRPPVLRGASETIAALRGVTAWEAAHDVRVAPTGPGLAGAGPRRAAWPALAGDRTPYAWDPEVEAAGSATIDRVVLAEREALELLRTAGLPVIEARAAADAAGAVPVAEAIGYPVAVKLDAVGLAHKSDIGGVRLGLASAPAVETAVGEILSAAWARGGIGVRGVLVEPMATPGVELVVGLVRDPQFGPAVLVGLGGVFAEVLKDTAIRLAPVSHADALAMLAGLRCSAILAGVRAAPPVDRAAVADIIVRLGRLGMDRPDLLEVDLNPVIASAAGALAVDALAVVAVGRADVRGTRPGTRPGAGPRTSRGDSRARG